jgi:hypothetical protein
MAEYRFRGGLTAKTVTAEQAYTELERIRAAHDEKLSPHDIVSESRPKGAVLHPLFEWNDKAAAEEYRVHQARRLSRAVYVVEPAHNSTPERENPVYFHVQANNYQPSDVVITRVDYFEQALQVLHRQLASAERAVRELEHLAHKGDDPDRLAAIGLASQGFAAVREALAIIK